MRNGGMEAYNNTFYDTRTYCLEISGPTPRVAYLNFKNNICHMSPSATSYTRYESDAPVSDAERNIYYGLGSYVVTVQHADGTVYLTQPAQVQIGRTSNIKQD